jgi:O-antigen ligase
VWQPDPVRLLTGFVTSLVIAFSVYSGFLLAVVFSAGLSDLLLIYPMLYRVGSNTTAIAMTIFLLAFFLWLERHIRGTVVLLSVGATGIVILLTQSRVATAMLLILLLLAVGLYTVRTGRSRFLKIGTAIGAALVISLLMAFVLLNKLVPDFSSFSELFFERVERDQAGRGLWDSMIDRSFGTAEFRTRVVQDALERPVFGYGEGKGVGPTMSQDDGAYIDSAVITIWFKNGIVGLVLFYVVWGAIIRRFITYLGRTSDRLYSGVASIGLASVVVWVIWSSANIFLMYGWVMYPILAIISTLMYFLEHPVSSATIDIQAYIDGTRGARQLC